MTLSNFQHVSYLTKYKVGCILEIDWQHTYSFTGNFILFSCNKMNLLADKEFLSTEVVVVDDDVETSPNTEFMFEEFWAE